MPFMQEPLAQIQNVSQTVAAVYQMPIEDMEKLFISSPVARTNWTSHVIMFNSSLPYIEGNGKEGEVHKDLVLSKKPRTLVVHIIT